jgi:hypothetical protein
MVQVGCAHDIQLSRPSLSDDRDSVSTRRRRWADRWERSAQDLGWSVVTLGQAATIILTWDLWSDRQDPPLLPAVQGLPALSTGWLLLLSLAIAARFRRVGTGAHAVVVVGAIVLDQTRLQPEVVSITVLLVALAFPAWRVVGRAHLVTLWVWAGLNKLLSTGFEAEGAPFVSEGLRMPMVLAQWGVPVVEIALGLLAAVPRARRAAVVLSVAVHGLILATLLLQQRNVAVWAWNAVIPVAAAALLAGDRTTRVLSRATRQTVRSAGTKVAVAVWAVVALYPAGFYVGVVDAYLAHHLYSGATHRALVCSTGRTGHTDGAALRCTDPFTTTWSSLRVPLPPEPRLYRQWFELDCRAGDVLRIAPRRTRIANGATQEHACPAG